MQQSPFRNKVYDVAKRIPKGSVATYQQIAQMAGSPHGARAVGWCMKNNPDLKAIPCHRVVASNGELTGYAVGEGVKTKKEMLIQEGVTFQNNHVDLSKSQWHPDNNLR